MIYSFNLGKHVVRNTVFVGVTPLLVRRQLVIVLGNTLQIAC